MRVITRKRLQNEPLAATLHQLSDPFLEEFFAEANFKDLIRNLCQLGLV